MRKKALFLLIYLSSYSIEMFGAWDKAEGMRKHGRDESNTSAIVFGSFAGLFLLYFIYVIIKSAMDKKKK